MLAAGKSNGLNDDAYHPHFHPSHDANTHAYPDQGHNICRQFPSGLNFQPPEHGHGNKANYARIQKTQKAEQICLQHRADGLRWVEINSAGVGNKW